MPVSLSKTPASHAAVSPGTVSSAMSPGLVVLTLSMLLGVQPVTFGRRPILLWGLAGYTLASIGSVLAPSMALLIVWRALQGAAMGAVVMGARAIARDLYLPADGARIMSKGLSGLGVLACLSAPLGALLAELFGWRAALMAVATFGGCTLALIALRFALSAWTLVRKYGEPVPVATLTT